VAHGAGKAIRLRMGYGVIAHCIIKHSNKNTGGKGNDY
jgi:hypothetical protein